MKNLALRLILISILFACKHELETPSWETDMIIPVANMEMSIIDLVKYDENGINTSTDQDSLIHLIYNKIIFEGNLDTLIQINAITDEQTHTLDSARFNDVTIIETATIGETISEIPFGTILFPNGSLNNIPDIPGIINEDTLNIDASEYFETMTLFQGNLIVKITNGYPTDIANVSLSLINQNNLNLIGSFDFPLISTGETVIDSISIAGEILDENIAGIIHNIDVNASNGSVLINYDDEIKTEITLSNIGIIEATAIFPEQQLTENLKEHSFNLGQVSLTEIGIKSGTVKVNVLSTLPNGKMIYNIPSLTKNGIAFSSGDMIVPEATNTELTTFEFDFEGYTLDLTGKDGRNLGDTINTIYTEAYTFIDSTGELVTINQLDSFYSYIEFDLEPEYAIGNLGRDTFIFDQEIIYNEIFSSVTNGNLDLKQTNLDFIIENFVGSEAVIIIDEFSTNNSLSNQPPVSPTFDQNGNPIIGHPYFIEKATMENDNIIPESKIITMDASNMLEILPDQNIIAATFIINPNENTYSDHFIYPDQTINASINIDIPLSFIAEDLTIEKQIDTDFNFENNLEIEELYINLENHFPLSSNINVFFLDDNESIIDTVINNMYINSANLNNQNIVISPSKDRIIIRNKDFNELKKINIRSTFSTASLYEHVNIYSDYKMAATISIRLKRIINN